MQYLTAKKPNKLVDGCYTKVAHKMVYMETEQHDPVSGSPNGTYSRMKLTIVQDWNDVVFIRIEVDGKHHILTSELVEVLKSLNDLVKETSIEKTTNP